MFQFILLYLPCGICYLNIRSLLDKVEKRTWKQEQNTVCSLLTSNIVLSFITIFQTIPVQTNGYDCGVLMLKVHSSINNIITVFI